MMPLLLFWQLNNTSLLKHLIAELNYALVVIHNVWKHASLLLLLLRRLKRIIFINSSTLSRQIGLSLKTLLGDSKGVMVIINDIWILNRNY
jgi:hypothetical protein